MSFDLDCVVGERQHIFVADAEALAIGDRRGYVARGQARAAFDVDHLDALAAEHAAQHGAMVCLESRLEDIEFVGIDRSLHDVFAKTIRAGNEHDIAKSRLGIEGKDHAARSQVRTHHLHHADRQRDLEVVEALVDPIMDGAVGEKAGETAPAGIEELRVAMHVEEAFVHSGEARVGQVFGGRRRAHSEAELSAVLGLQAAISLEDLGTQIVGKPGTVDDVAHLVRAPGEIGHVGRIEPGERLFQHRHRTRALQHVPIGIGGDRKSVGYAYALCAQFTEHFAERGVFAADSRHVRDADILEKTDVAISVRHYDCPNIHWPMQRRLTAPCKAAIHEPIYPMRAGPTLREIKEGRAWRSAADKSAGPFVDGGVRRDRYCPRLCAQRAEPDIGPAMLAGDQSSVHCGKAQFARWIYAAPEAMTRQARGIALQQKFFH